jgi:anti-anti-sigma factor
VTQVRREFTTDPGQLAELRRLVRAACREAWGTGTRDRALDEIELAVQEAATNIVRHAYRGEVGRPIRLDLTAGPDRVDVTLSHDGDDFDPAAVPPPAFDGSRYGGFGLYLIRRCADEVYHLRGGPGDRGIRLVKHRTPVPAERAMSITVELFGDLAVATVNAEELTVANADDVKADLDPVLQTARDVILDLSQVRFVDSRGCGVILSCLKQLASRGGDLRLCCVTPPVAAVFNLIRLHKICEIHETRDEAIRVARPPGGA